LKVIKVAIIVGVGYLGYGYYQGGLTKESPFSGEWKSNKELSMKELYKKGLTQKQESFFRKVLGNMTYSISGNSWESTFNGETHSSTYTVESENKGCYDIKFSDGIKNCCLIDGNLHIPSKIGPLSFNEVFSPE